MKFKVKIIFGSAFSEALISYQKMKRNHRDNGPAVIYQDGTKKWYQNGVLHREDGPAIIWDCGSKHWMINGDLHREDGPAIEASNGDEVWYQFGKKHRIGGPAVIRDKGRLKVFYTFGNLNGVLND